MNYLSSGVAGPRSLPHPTVRIFWFLRRRRVCEPHWLEIKVERGPVVRYVAVVGVVDGIHPVMRLLLVLFGGLCRIPETVTAGLVLSLSRMELRMDGTDVGEADVVTGGDSGQHRAHVVEKELNGSHPRSSSATSTVARKAIGGRLLMASVEGRRIRGDVVVEGRHRDLVVLEAATAAG